MSTRPGPGRHPGWRRTSDRLGHTRATSPGHSRVTTVTNLAWQRFPARLAQPASVFPPPPIFQTGVEPDDLAVFLAVTMGRDDLDYLRRIGSVANEGVECAADEDWLSCEVVAETASSLKSPGTNLLAIWDTSFTKAMVASIIDQLVEDGQSYLWQQLARL